MGHTAGAPAKENEVKTTCSSDGSWDVVVRCPKCGEILSTQHASELMYGHNWDNGKVTTDPTCNKEGIKTFTCSRCSTTKTESIDKLDHTPGSPVQENVIAAKCTEDGSYDEVVYCTDCNEEISRINKTVGKLGHKYKAEITYPTFNTPGYTTYTCERCGDNYVENEIKVLGDTVEEVFYQSTDEPDFTNHTLVLARIDSNYNVTIPKVIVLSGAQKEANYFVKVDGDIAGYEKVNVTPEENVTLKSSNKSDQVATISQDKTTWKVLDFNTDANGLISAKDLTAGKWSGTFNFNISFEQDETFLGW